MVAVTSGRRRELLARRDVRDDGLIVLQVPPLFSYSYDHVLNVIIHYWKLAGRVVR